MKITTRIAYTVFPPHVWSTLKWELKFSRQRWANLLMPPRRDCIKRLKSLQNIKVHLGCGERILDEWINIDGLERPGVDLCWDLRCSLPFSDQSVYMIYTEHVLEHFFKDDAVRLLQECYRILSPEGKIRIGVPDAAIYLNAYIENNTGFFQNLEHLGGAVTPLTTPIDVINQMFRMGGHHLFAWDFTALSQTLASIGFTNISRWLPGQASTAEICLDDPAHAFETLYVEAEK